jgi:predicted nucleic acid-binding protein
VAERIVVDANPLFAALLGGKAVKVIYQKEFEFITAVHTIWEVKKYIPDIAHSMWKKSKRKSEFINVKELEETLHAELAKFPLKIVHPQYYSHTIEQAKILISSRDITDVDILALTLAVNSPLWSNDKDFEGIEEIELLKTEDMLKKSELLFEKERPYEKNPHHRHQRANWQ